MERIKKWWAWFDWELFRCFMDFTDEEIEAMPERLAFFHKRVYDISMFFVMFGAFTYAGARIYEDMSMAALGMIPPNFIQLSPLVMLVVLTGFLYYASTIAERFEYGYNARESNKQDPGQFPGRSVIV